MIVLIDTNILTRSIQPGHPMHNDALDALDVLRKLGEELCVVAQNLYEFWAVATRPLDVNGMGLTTSQAQTELSRIKNLFRFLSDTPAVYVEWEKLVVEYAVSGRKAHDTRIVAAMKVHGLMNLLTFNANDFKRFQEITVLTPQEVLKERLPTQSTDPVSE